MDFPKGEKNKKTKRDVSLSKELRTFRPGCTQSVSEQTRNRLPWCRTQAFGFDVAISPNCHARFEYFAARKSHHDLQTSVSWDKRRSSHHWRMPQSAVLTQLLKEVLNETFLYKREHVLNIIRHFCCHVHVFVTGMLRSSHVAKEQRFADIIEDCKSSNSNIAQ